MIAKLIAFFRDNPAIRTFSAAGVLIVTAGIAGAHVIATAVDLPYAARFAAGDTPNGAASRTRLVTRSVLDDDIVTGSITAQAANARLDPCVAPVVKK